MSFSRGARLDGPHRLDGPPASRVLILLPLLFALLAVAGAWYGWSTTHKPPGALANYRAVGPRDEVNCLRLVIGVDVSGSMRDFAVARDDALQQLFDWVKQNHNLRPDDQVAIIDFAAVAQVRMQPTAVSRLGSLPAPTGARDGTYTYFQPVLADISQFPSTQCDTALVLISDAQLIDLPVTQVTGQQLLAAHHVGRIRLLVPGAGIQVGTAWTKGFPAATPLVFDGQDPAATGVALGNTIVGLTGQTLKRVS